MKTVSKKYKLIFFKIKSISADDPLSCRPEVFFLFILSHGRTRGEILTDHLLEGTDPKDLQFDTYRTSDVWEGLASLDVLEPCLKLLFFGVSK